MSCIKKSDDYGVNINRITTDRHVSISSCMDKEHRNKKHQYDIWHVSKWVVKQLTKKAKLKGNEDLFPWIQSISNHLWWSAASCNGDVELLREKWRSVLHHTVTSIHEKTQNSLTDAVTQSSLWSRRRRLLGSNLVLLAILLSKK